MLSHESARSATATGSLKIISCCSRPVPKSTSLRHMSFGTDESTAYRASSRRFVSHPMNVVSQSHSEADELSDGERGRFDRLCAIIRAFAKAAKNPAVWVGSLTSCLATSRSPPTRYRPCRLLLYYMYTDGICWKLKESKT